MHSSINYETQKSNSIAFSIIIPVYNEEAGIAATISDVKESLQQTGYQYEIIIVNDGSTDKTYDILCSQTDVKVMTHRRNRGYGAALKTGIRAARYSIIVITDGDGTYPNEKIIELVPLMQEADMVVGARTGTNVHYSWLRRIPKWFLVRFAEWITNSHIPDLNSGLRVFDKRIAEKFIKVLPDTFSFTTTITVAMLTNGYVVCYEPIDYYARQGRSKIKPIRDTLLFAQLTLRTGLYFAPLKIFLPVASVFFLGFLYTLMQDIFVRQDLTERTLILLIASTQTAMFALLADMIDKRTG